MLGIKGSGMAALATLLSSLGLDVSGCDREEYIFTQDLLDEKGIRYYSDIVDGDYDFIIKGNSYECDYKFSCPVYKYIDVLRYLSCRYNSIAVCGSHGKTTTTGMLSTILKDKCIYLIGDGSGGGIKDDYFVFEACEYKRNFLSYNPSYILITNIELDHIDYYKDIEDYIQTSEGASFSLCYKGKMYNDIHLNLYAKHQIYNAVGSIFIAMLLGENIDVIINNLSLYKVNKRRFNIEEIGSNIIVDDYGHQPSQIKATLESLKIKYKDKKMVCIFKPDRYSRLFYFKENFIDVLSLFDESYICNFPSCSSNDLSFPFSPFCLVGDGIKFFDEKDFSIFRQRENTVFLVTSSKYVNNIKEGIKEMLNDD